MLHCIFSGASQPSSLSACFQNFSCYVTPGAILDFIALTAFCTSSIVVNYCCVGVSSVIAMLECHLLLQCWSVIYYCNVGVSSIIAVLECHLLLQCWSVIYYCNVGVSSIIAVLEYHLLLQCWSVIYYCNVGALLSLSDQLLQQCSK